VAALDKTVSLSGTELGWKRINEMRIETWNVHIVYRAEAMNEMVKDVEVQSRHMCSSRN